MNTKLIALLAFIALASGAYAHSHHHYTPSSYSNDYDYYVFTTEWAGAVCQSFNCDDDDGIDTAFWNIHGLWPSQNTNSYEPSNCGGNPFSLTGLPSTIQTDIKKYWSGLYNSDQEFLDHEWTKHGTCWVDSTTGSNKQDDFFTTVLTLAQKFNAYNVLAGAGIYPDNDKALSGSEIASAFESAYSVTEMIIQCHDNELSGIQVCLDKSYTPINCPDGGKNTCGDQVTYPALSAY